MNHYSRKARREALSGVASFCSCRLNSGDVAPKARRRVQISVWVYIYTRFSTDYKLETLNMELHFAIGESHLTISEVSMREQGQ